MAVRVLVNMACVLVYVLHFWLDTSLLGYSVSTPFVCRLSYMFAHNGLLHLFFNLFSLNVLWRTIERKGIVCGAFVSFAAAFASTYFSAYEMPTVGMSGVCFGMLGVLTTNLYRNKDYMVTLFVIAAVQVFYYFFTTCNVLNHAFAFSIALVLEFLIDVTYGKSKRERTTPN